MSLKVIGDMDGAEPPLSTMPRPGQRTPEVNQEDEGPSSTLQLRERKRTKPVWRESNTPVHCLMAVCVVWRFNGCLCYVVCLNSVFA